MAIDTRIVDDLARIASGALGAAVSLRDEAQTQMKERLAGVFANLDLVTREEFEAVREMAAQARAEQEAMAARLDALEARLAEEQPSAKPSGRRRKTAEDPTG
ncbi:MAG: accessory factor UbiK family protein [Rhodospirillaceae bacterium]|nr:accessory factor UbiK family protein [Rhodospirillaceae bacterium]